MGRLAVFWAVAGALCALAFGSPAPAGPQTPPPSPGPSPVAMGVPQKVGGLSFTVVAATETHLCPSGYGKPNQAAKYVAIHAAVKNEGEDVARIPYVRWWLGKYGAGSCWSGSDQKAFDSGCRVGHQLFPGAQCEGWLAFEVPEKLFVKDANVEVDSGVGRAAWRLRGD